MKNSLTPSAFLIRLSRLLTERRPLSLQEDDLIPSSVLIPIYPMDEGLWIILTRRSQNVAHHKGEISFPGGTQDPTDRDRLHTALRETQEELGINPKDVIILGQLDEAFTLTGYRVTPFVGSLPFPYPFNPNRREIAEVIQVELGSLFLPQILREEVHIWRGRDISVPYYELGLITIWGATARILRNLLDIIRTDSSLMSEIEASGINPEPVRVIHRVT